MLETHFGWLHVSISPLIANLSVRYYSSRSTFISSLKTGAQLSHKLDGEESIGRRG